MNTPLEVCELSMSKASWELADLHAKRLNLSRDAAVEFVLANFDPREERLPIKISTRDYARILVERYSTMLEREGLRRGMGMLIPESVVPDARDESEG